MHFAPTMTPTFSHHHARTVERPAAKLRPRSAARASAAWHNWWAMSVVDPPSVTARQTRTIGTRGRMPGV
ncbi:hypothetical protein [Nocardioides marmoribigeumensis]|uniref:Uncharacterized protein n=1 Tax=Nocardioides marmoribigeumensis TaxID=433649 RepID=A0ABU2BU00_9ACTN|nr:hypothetical protein [Nocardioides marmoribigeumensis]MDR7362103.1 hypothetical protein [Nocardioides marmoribigeumensis]